MKYPTEWERNRGSKSMPKCLEGMRFEVMLRNGESIVVSDARHDMDWQNDNLLHNITKYRILGPIAQEPDALDHVRELANAEIVSDGTGWAAEAPTLESMINDWKHKKLLKQSAQSTIEQCEELEQAAREAVQKALADAGWGDAAPAPEKPSRSGQEVVWGEWEVGDVVVFDGYTCTDSKCWEYIKGNKYTIGKDMAGDIGPVDDGGDSPSENLGFRFIWP